MNDFHVVDASVVMGDKILENDKKLMKLLSSYHKVSLGEANYNHFAEMLHWCLENCESKFRDIPNMRYNRRDWYFEKERDAIMFALKWGD